MDRGDQARRTELLAAATGPKRAPDRAGGREAACHDAVVGGREGRGDRGAGRDAVSACARTLCEKVWDAHVVHRLPEGPELLDRKSTRLNSSHGSISYAVFCLKKKNK